MITLVSVFALATAAPAVDHSTFDALLRSHVSGGLVDYDAFARRPEFRAYLDALAGAEISGLGEKERLAFWINVYNAFTIEQINRHAERDSIRNIRRTLGLLPLKGPWSEPMVRAAGQKLTLDDVEHEIIRKQFKEPRIHFALVCAALSCPPLRSEAYTALRLDEQLDDQARAFLLRSPALNRADLAARTLWLSPIFLWYREDFGGTDAEIGRFVAGYLGEGKERELLLSGRFRLRETEYDWTLNSVAKGSARPAR